MHSNWCRRWWLRMRMRWSWEILLLSGNHRCECIYGIVHLIVIISSSYRSRCSIIRRLKSSTLIHWRCCSCRCLQHIRIDVTWAVIIVINLLYNCHHARVVRRLRCPTNLIRMYYSLMRCIAWEKRCIKSCLMNNIRIWCLNECSSWTRFRVMDYSPRVFQCVFFFFQLW